MGVSFYPFLITSASLLVDEFNAITDDDVLWRCEFYVKCQRRVKTEDLGVFEAFSVGDITVRKANDPSCVV